ncbi:N-acetyl sugar amidotransferase [Roseivirga echinicomitans]|uniref:LPS biosynthesis protein n=1 Tax=Roseivirga echinicomitans TaxID=296218 RepID=A0A150XW26_9BACT|nr:N-acetyl sugar amidotransferase [Roseivirga echinicomitans]KYG82844.1 LPS biosynthesis protein [Roseivirga echinicomitans]
MNQTETFFGLPAEVKFCKKCVISNQRPSSTVEFENKKGEKKEVIDFDEYGVCSACRYNEEKDQGIDWSQREETLMKLLDKFRRNDGRYDVIVPGSGGKDSAYTAHILKHKYGMNPLTVTWAPHLYTDIGWKNFTNWMHEGALDNILYTPDGKLHRYLTKLAFHNLLHPFQPFIIGQRIIGPAMAARFGVELVMYGENQAEYGNKVDENNIPTMDTKFFSVDDPMKMKLGGISMADLIDQHGYKMNDFTPYIPTKPEVLKEKGIQVHYLGYYLKWDPQECYYYAVENTGFQANTERTEGSYSKYSSIDDKIDPFHYYTTLIKFGIGRATYDAAQEVRNDKITREEGVLLAQKFDQEFPKRFFQEFLEYIDTTEEEFWETIEKNRSPHLWAKEANGEWKLRYTAAGDGLDD